MNRYLLDTHCLLWFQENNKDIPNRVMDVLKSTENEVFFSQISLFEIAIKQKIGKLPDFKVSISEIYEQAFSDLFTFLPILNQSKNYAIDFNAPLKRGTITNKLTSTSFNVLDVNGIERTVIFDEIPQSSSGITSIGVTDAGTGYTSAPTVTITGDGTGATAEAIIVNGRVQNINIVDRGTDYTRAVVTVTGGDGYGAAAIAIVDGRVGTLRTIYYDSAAQRQIVDDNVGEIDYSAGLINIFDINMLSVASDDGYIRLSFESEKGIVETIRSTIITIDETDPTSITIDLVKISD
jgi:PIN domain nuclease of toxin-antitoxin system